MTNNNHIETDVLITGGGPVGLSMATELRYQGIDCILLEQTDGVVTDPKVSTVGPRSMEFCRRWGIAQEIRDAGWPDDHTGPAAMVLLFFLLHVQTLPLSQGRHRAEKYDTEHNSSGRQLPTRTRDRSRGRNGL